MNYYEKNLKLLEKKQPKLAELMKEEIDTSHIEVLTAETGIPTARVTTPEGKKVILHDMKDPVARAKEHVEKLELIGNNGSVLLGFGLGYLALEMANAMEDGHLLFLCEADPAIFKVALEEVDLEPILESGMTKILLGKEIDLPTNLNNIAMKYLTSKISVVKFNPSFAIDPETYNSLQKRAQETATHIQVNANTILMAGKEMSGNILTNIPEIISSAGVKSLFDRFKGVPAIVVGAGPSLDKNVTLLKEVKDNAVIISVDRALGLLLPLGITPHLVSSIDYSRLNYDEKYSSLQINEQLFMVFAQTLYPKITKSFWGPKFSMHLTGKLSEVLGYYWGDKGLVPTGMHVGHLSFCLARAIGCNPIILTGMDLAFTGNKFHAEDVESSLKFPTSDKYTSVGILGDIIQSDATFSGFVITLSNELKNTDALCIDASEGGARKEGSKIMRLRDAIDEYCQDDHPEIRTILEEESSKTDTAKCDELIKDLKRAEEESKKMKKASESTLKIVKKIRKMQADGKEGSPEYITLSHKAEKLTFKAEGEGRIMSMLENYNFPNIVFMSKDETRRIDEIEDQYEKLNKQIGRAEAYYKNFNKALTSFIQDIRQILKRLTVDRKAKDTFEKSPKKRDDYLEYGLQLIKTENYTDAEAAFKKVIDLKPEHGDAYYHLGKVYSEQNRLETAIPVLEKAISLKKKFTKAKDLLQRCRKKNQQWQEKCEELKEKFFKEPAQGRDEKEIILEAGNFYFRVKDYERAENEYLKVIEKHPSLPEAHYHLGHTYFAMKDFDKGVEALSRALELDPDNPAIYRDLGLVSIDRGLVESAEKFFLKAIELKPDDPELKEILGNIYFNNSMFDKAITIYEEIVKSNPNRQEATNNLSLAYQALIKDNTQAEER